MSNSQDTSKFDPEEWRETLIQMREKCETESLDAVAELEKLLDSGTVNQGNVPVSTGIIINR